MKALLKRGTTHMCIAERRFGLNRKFGILLQRVRL